MKWDIRFLMCTYVTFVFVYMLYMYMYTKLRNPVSFPDVRRSGNEAGFLSLYVCIHIQVTYNMLLGVCHICLCRYVTYVYVYVCDIYTKSYMAYIDRHITY